MSPAAVSLAALVLALAVSCTTRINAGVLSIFLAWLAARYAGFSAEQTVAGFPASLFVTLAGVTLLFSQAQQNGTLDRVAQRAVLICKGNAGWTPLMIFALAAAFSSAGPGSISTAALLAPMAMSIAGSAGIPAFLMAIMVGNGSNAGSLSPITPTGVIVNGLIAQQGMAGMEWQLYWYNFGLQALIAVTGYLVLGGWKLFSKRRDDRSSSEALLPFERAHWLTLAVIGALAASTLFGGINVGVAAFACASLLALLRAADHTEAIRRMPWQVILMVCGVTVLIATVERAQGMALFADLISRLSTRESVTGVVAFLTGLVSVYSSTSGVVLPAFLPIVPGLVQRLGGGDPAAIASSMSIGAHLVDVSPLSTIGALCIAAAPAGVDERKLFRQMLVWALSMTVVGGLACYLLL